MGEVDQKHLARLLDQLGASLDGASDERVPILEAVMRDVVDGVGDPSLDLQTRVRAAVLGMLAHNSVIVAEFEQRLAAAEQAWEAMLTRYNQTLDEMTRLTEQGARQLHNAERMFESESNGA